MVKEDKVGMILLAIVLLVMITGLKSPTFILYGGEEIAAELTNETGECWTLGMNDCARQTVNLLRLKKSGENETMNATGLLICPEGYYTTLIDCRKAYEFIEEVEEPKLDCYYVKEDVCYKEQFEEQCPAIYFTNIEDCKESLVDFGFSIKTLFTSRKTIIMSSIGLIALLFMVISFLIKK